MLGGVLDGPGDGKDESRILAVGCHGFRDAHPSGRDGSGLIKHGHIDSTGGLEHLRTLDQDAELGAATRSYQEGCGRGEAERARARNDQHGDGGGERGLHVACAQPVPGTEGEPDAEREEREPDHDRHEHGRDPVGEALNRGLSGLSAGDQAADLSQRGIRAHAGGPH